MKDHIEDIKAIREMMERSTKFLSLSGMSGIVAGCAALAGASFAYFYLLRDPSLTDYTHRQEMIILLAVAVAVLAVSVGFGVWFSWRKARNRGEKLFNPVTRRTIYNLAVPLLAGGLFCLAFLFRGELEVAVSGTLVFYGLALINTSKYTFEEIHSLGLTEVAIGIVSAFLPCYGFLLWTLGFGVCHIIYGIILYRKYDRVRK